MQNLRIAFEQSPKNACEKMRFMTYMHLIFRNFGFILLTYVWKKKRERFIFRILFSTNNKTNELNGQMQSLKLHMQRNMTHPSLKCFSDKVVHNYFCLIIGCLNIYYTYNCVHKTSFVFNLKWKMALREKGESELFFFIHGGQDKKN